MALPFLAVALLSLAMSIASYILMPKAKQPRSQAFDKMQNPTASGGVEVKVVFGTVAIKGPNVLGFWNKSMETREIDA